MSWIDLLCAIIFFAVAFGAIFLFWYLEKPERELRKKRLEAEWKFYHTAGYVFEHIACNIDCYDSALNRIENALIGMDMSLSNFLSENFDLEEDK